MEWWLTVGQVIAIKKVTWSYLFFRMKSKDENLWVLFWWKMLHLTWSYSRRVLCYILYYYHVTFFCASTKMSSFFKLHKFNFIYCPLNVFLHCMYSDVQRYLHLSVWAIKLIKLCNEGRWLNETELK